MSVSPHPSPGQETQHLPWAWPWLGVGGDTNLSPTLPRACGLLREAGKWTVTDRLTHVSSGDLSPSGPTERTGARVKSDGRGGTRAGLLSLSRVYGLDYYGHGIPCEEVTSVLTGVVRSYCPSSLGSLLSEAKATWTLGMVRPFLGTMQ